MLGRVICGWNFNWLSNSSQVEESVRLKDREYSGFVSKKNAILVNHGKLQQEAEVGNKDFENRNKSISTVYDN